MKDTCLRIRALLHDYLEGELPRATMNRVREHLASCRSCEQHAERWNDDLEQMLEAPTEGVPENFAPTVRRTLRWRRKRRFLVARGLSRFVPPIAVLLLPFLAYHAYRAIERSEARGPDEVVLHGRKDIVVVLRPRGDFPKAPLEGPLTMWSGTGSIDLRYEPSLTLTAVAGTVLHRERELRVSWNRDPSWETLLPFDALWGRATLRSYETGPPRIELPFEHLLELEARSTLSLASAIEAGPGPEPAGALTDVPFPTSYELRLQGGAARVRDPRGVFHSLERDEPYWITAGGLCEASGSLRGRVHAIRQDGSPWGPWPYLSVIARTKQGVIQTRTAGDGTFHLLLPRMEASFESLEFVHDDVCVEKREWKFPPGDSFDVKLHEVPRRSLNLDTAGGTPLSGATIEVRDTRGARLRTTADHRGVAVFPELFPPPWDLSIHHDTLSRPWATRVEDLSDLTRIRVEVGR